MKCVIILGCRQDWTWINDELRLRVERALDIYSESTIFIASGGKTNGIKPEAEYIAEYLSSKGIPNTAILMEPDSTDTIENAVYSKILIDSMSITCDSITIVTSCYHEYRAKFIFKNIFEKDVSVLCADYNKVNDENAKFIRDAIRIYNNINNQNILHD